MRYGLPRPADIRNNKAAIEKPASSASRTRPAAAKKDFCTEEPSPNDSGSAILYYTRQARQCQAESAMQICSRVKTGRPSVRDPSERTCSGRGIRSCPNRSRKTQERESSERPGFPPSKSTSNPTHSFRFGLAKKRKESIIILNACKISHSKPPYILYCVADTKTETNNQRLSLAYRHLSSASAASFHGQHLFFERL